MKKLALAVATLFTAAAPAFAAYDRYGNWVEPRYNPVDSARVIESRPVYEAANTREECWNPRAGHYEELRGSRRSGSDRTAGTVAGAVIGGVLGHQIDRGGGTAAGAILGGVIGNQVARERGADDQSDLDRSRCRVVAEGPRTLQGYDVRYSYNGVEYTTRMANEPGRRLALGSDIREDGTPFDAPASYSYVDPYYGR